MDRLGARDQGTQFDETRELVVSALLYDPDAVFALINKAAKDLGVTNNATIELCDELLDALDDLVMPDKPVESVTALSDAATALRTMQGALARRGVIGASEYSRYSSAVDRAAGEFGRTTKVTYTPRGASQATKDIVRSSSNAKLDVATFFSSLRESHSELLDRAGYILSALEQFSAANLAAEAGTRQLSRAADQMGALYLSLDGKLPHERTESARQALLEVLANRSVVKALRSRQSPGQPRVIQEAGTAALYRIAPAGTGTPAETTGNVSAPWEIKAGAADNLQGNYNGTVVDVDLVPGSDSGIQGVQQARVDGSVDGPFPIHEDIPDPYPLQTENGPWDVPTGSTFQILINGTRYECALTPGLARTAGNIGVDLATPGNWVTPPGIAPIGLAYPGAALRLISTDPSPPASYSEREFEVIVGPLAPNNAGTPWAWFVDEPSLGLVSGTRSYGWDANNELYIHPNDYDNFELTPIVAVLRNGAWPGFHVAAADIVTDIDTTATFYGEAFEGVLDGDRVGIRSTFTQPSGILGGEGSVIEIKSDGLRTSGARNGLSTPSHAGMRALGFSEGQEDRQANVDGHAVVKALNADLGFSAEAEASTDRNVIFQSKTGGWAFGGILTAIIEGGGGDPTGDWPAASEMKLAVIGGANRGVYGITSYSYFTFAGYEFARFQLDRKMRGADPGVAMEIEVYTEHLKIQSKKDDTTSRVTIQPVFGDSARDVIGLSSTDYYGSVDRMLVEVNDPVLGWKPHDLRGLKIKIGDKVVGSSGGEIAEITGIEELEDGVVVVSPEVMNWISYSAFSIVSADYLAYLTFIEGLQAWWDDLSPFDEDLVYLNRALNPILNSTPNRNRVDAVYAKVMSLRDKLTGSSSALTELIEAFIVRKSGPVESSLKTLSDRGLDRARDLLKSGQFEEFFSSSARNSSYGSAFLDQAAAVVVQDLNKASAAQGRYDAEFMRHASDWEEDIDPSLIEELEEELPEDDLEEYWPGVDEEVG